MTKFLFTLIILMMPLVLRAEKMTFASPENLPPKIYMENGKLRGTYVDVIREVCKRMNVEPIFVQYPWPRAVAMVKIGKVDAIFPPFKTVEREEFLIFPNEPMSFTRNVLFARKARNIKVKKLDDLQGMVVGINDQYSYGSQFDSIKHTLTLDLSRTEEMQINKLAHQGQVRMDVVAASEEAFKFLSKKMGLSREFEIVYIISEAPSYVAFSKAGGEKTKKQALEFNRILKQLRKDGTIQDINEQYYK